MHMHMHTEQVQKDWLTVKGKGSPLTIFVQSCSTLGGGAHPRFQAIEPAFCPKTIFRGHMASAT